MGGGHVSRPDFGMPQPDAAYPLTEFYLLAQQALEKSGSFMLPALYAGLQAPARRIYREEARRDIYSLRTARQEGADPAALPGAGCSFYTAALQRQPDGTPAALLLTEECTRLTVAVQLLPPFVWEDPLPPLPDVPAALTLQLTMQDVMADRHRPGRTGAESWLAQHDGQALAAPPEGRDLSCRAAGPAAKGLYKKEHLPLIHLRFRGYRPVNRQDINPCRRTWTCLAVRCVRYTKNGRNRVLFCNNRGC
ncbi:MAG: hypothetical protein ACLVJH_08150 [Faecalibacterium prausnitzii]